MKSNTRSMTLRKLSSKKNYYIRIRTYKVVNGKKYYSKWSTVDKVTININVLKQKTCKYRSDGA